MADLKGPWRFFLNRTEDETGISGAGRVAEGVVFSDGRVALRWTPQGEVQATSTACYDSIYAVDQIHGHAGKTRICWLDDWEW